MQNIADNLAALWNKLHKITNLIGLLICVTGISSSVAAAPSDLDPTFGNGGKVLSLLDSNQAIPGYGMALQPDGKIIMVGGRWDEPGTVGFVVARYNADGSLDTTFGSNGWVSTIFGGTTETAISAAIQPDGKIVVGGQIYFPVGGGGQFDIGIARYNSNGSLDTSFNGSGKVTVAFSDFAGSYQDYLTSIKITNDGKIVFAGGAGGLSFSFKTIVGRLNANGSLDTSFDGDGKVIDGGGMWNDLIVQPDGTMFAVGRSSSQFETYMIAARYNSNGIRAWSYSRGQDFAIAKLNGIAAQPDGKVVMVGTYSNKITAVRLNADGSVDNSFNIPATPPDGEALSVAIQSNGKIVANVETPVNSGNSFSLIRYNTDGTPDTGFGSGGIVTTARLNGGRDYALKTLIQPNGKILVGGSSANRFFFSMVRYQGDPVVSGKASFDYDGDGKADVSVFRPSAGAWYLNNSANGFSATQFGVSTDKIAPADYDGDNKTDIAVYRGGSWFILNSNGGIFSSVNFGVSGDIPIPADFDGDGKADISVFRPSNGGWYRLNSSNGQFVATTFGTSGDKPLSGDFDGDAKADIAVYRPASGSWYRLNSSDGAFVAVTFGTASDKPVPANYDGDNKTDIAVFRDGVWYRLNSSDGQFVATTFGTSGDLPVAADYDGDGKTDVAVFRPSDGNWYQLRSTQGFSSQAFGIGSDVPTPNAYIP